MGETDDAETPNTVQQNADRPATLRGPVREDAWKPEPPKDDLELIDYDSERTRYGTLYIVGSVKNNSGRSYRYVEVNINLYDDEGNQVGSTIDNVTNLAAGDTWRFRAVALEDDVSRYKIVGVEGIPE